MKKLINIFLCIIILCSCSGIPKLRLEKKYFGQMDSGTYYFTDNGGHNENVKYEIIDDETAHIIIPINYVEKQNGRIPKKLPNVIQDIISKSYNLETVGICSGFTSNFSREKKDFACSNCCEITNKKLIITAKYDKNVYNNFIYRFFSIDNPFVFLNQSNVGINIDYQVYPRELFISCEQGSCSILDSNNKIVNEISISKTISVNQKKINTLLLKEEEYEKIRKQEEAKRKAEYEREQRHKQKLRAKECPGLYRTLYWAQQGGYIDPIMGVKVARRFEELDCGTWLNEQLNGY